MRRSLFGSGFVVVVFLLVACAGSVASGGVAGAGWDKRTRFSDLVVEGDAAIGGQLEVAGDTVVGDLAVTGTCTGCGAAVQTLDDIPDLTATAPVTLTQLTVTGTCTGCGGELPADMVAETLTVSATTTLNGDTVIGNVDGSHGVTLTLQSGGASLVSVYEEAESTLLSVQDNVLTLGDAYASLIVAANSGEVVISGVVYGDKRLVVPQTWNGALAASLTGAIVVNQGASGGITITLPGAAAGLDYCFGVYAAQNLNIDPATGDQISVLTNGSGDKIVSATPGHAVCLVALDATYWFPYSVVGTWTDAN